MRMGFLSVPNNPYEKHRLNSYTNCITTVYASCSGLRQVTLMVSSEEVANVIQPILFLGRIKQWIGGLRIQLRGSPPTRGGASHQIEPGIDLEELLRLCAACVESVATDLPGAPVDEQLLDNLFWLAEQITMFELNPTLLPGGAVAIRAGLQRAAERWYAANEAA